MRRALNNKRLDDLIDLECLKTHHRDSCIIIEYPTGIKLPESFGFGNEFYIKNIDLLPYTLTIVLNKDIHFSHWGGMNLKYNLSKSQYVKFKIFVI